MNKITLLIAALFVALLGLTVSCKKGGSSGSDAKFLTAESFVATQWDGVTANGQIASLKVNSASLMVYTYYVKVEAVSKNTDGDKFVKTTVNITYQFDEAAGTFSGTGKEDSFNYTGSLQSTSSMQFNMKGQTVALSKK